MRVARRKLRGQAGYYHLYNRVTGPPGTLPLNEPMKAYAFQLVMDLAQYFTLEIISVCWLSNHFHVVVYAPAEPPSLELAARRHNAFYARRGDDYDPVSHRAHCELIAKRMIDISYFMAQVQQRVARKLNREGLWRGIVWNERFRSSIIGGDRNRALTIAAEAHPPQRPGGVWRCVKYVELNPVRAGLAPTPAAYHFSTWGRGQSGGHQPFRRHFIHHLKQALGDPVAARWTARELEAEFHGQMMADLAEDAGASEAQQHAVKVAARAQFLDNKPSTPMPPANPASSHSASELAPADSSARPPQHFAGQPPGMAHTRTPALDATDATQHLATAGPATPPANAYSCLALERLGRYWINGGIIGTVAFVEQVLAHLAAQRPQTAATPGSLLNPPSLAPAPALAGGAKRASEPTPVPAKQRPLRPLCEGARALAADDLVSYHQPYGPHAPRPTL